MKSFLITTVHCTVLALLTASLHAETLAYWRFETGPINANIPAEGTGGDGGHAAYENTVTDSSGNGNHMRTWNTQTSPLYIASGTSTVLQTGLTNSLALEFNPNQDLYTHGTQPIGSADLTAAFTVEASIRLDSKKWQVFVGKDGRPTGNSQSPFWFKGRDDNGHLEVSMIDTGGTPIEIQTLNAVTNGVWYHVAAVCNGSTLSFYLKGPGDADYVLQGSKNSTGGMINSTDTWTIGRGVWQGNLSDWIDGAVDEVRISNTALAPSAFLIRSVAVIPKISSVTLNTAGGTLDLNITNIPTGQTFHLTSSDTLGTFASLTPAIDFDSNTSQPISVPVTPSTVPKMFFRAESGASAVAP